VINRRRKRGLVVVLLMVVLMAAACGGSPKAKSSLSAGQLSGSQLPTGSGSKGSGTTIPLAKANPITALFTAIDTFQSCLTGLGVTFIGAPNPADPSSGANSPAYIKALTTCAAQSNILGALKSAQTAQQNLTQSQIKKENQEYLQFRTCMISDGWGIPEPTPNAQGLLFSFGATSVPDFTPPAGQNLLTSPDLQDCANKALSGHS
jgi:hypothetical protein